MTKNCTENKLHSTGISFFNYQSSPQIDKEVKTYCASEGEHHTVHGIESALIFFETQVKRVLRGLFSLFSRKKYFSYFSRDEDKDPDKYIYQKDSVLQSVESGTSIQNVGHATELIQVPKFNILTDPLFHAENSIFSPEKTQCGVLVEDLPPIDVVLISHNHKNHVDVLSLKKLLPQQPHLLVPQGSKHFFTQLGFQHVYEFDWYQQIEIEKDGKNIQFCAVPADHHSGRGIFDANTSSVNGWLINPKDNDGVFYFAGDTARLSEARMRAIAEILYFMNKNKNNAHIYNLEPGGPNYTRWQMETTHQSVLDSIVSSFRLATIMGELDEKLEKDPQKRKSAQEYLDTTSTILMHRNKFEKGSDRFNEDLIVTQKTIEKLDKIKTYPDFAQKSILDFNCERQQTTLTSLFKRNKTFIYEGIQELLDYSKKIWGKRYDTTHKLASFIKARVHFPKIGARMDNPHSIFPNYNQQQKSPYQDLPLKTVKPHRKK